MPLSHIEHYLVLSDEIDATRDWYRDVLGMQEGWHPDFGFPVYWMYLGGVDVVHIGVSRRMPVRARARSTTSRFAPRA